MTWDHNDDRNTHPDGNTPRGRSVIAARIMQLEADLARLSKRVYALESWLYGAVFLAMLLALAIVTIYTRGNTTQ